jgi:hypothetical protein
MSTTPSSSRTQTTETRRSLAMSEEFVCVGKALKLVSPFKGNKQEVLAFMGNVDRAFAVINPSEEDILYKFVLTRISREPQSATGILKCW